MFNHILLFKTTKNHPLPAATAARRGACLLLQRPSTEAWHRRDGWPFGIMGNPQASPWVNLYINLYWNGHPWRLDDLRRPPHDSRNHHLRVLGEKRGGTFILYEQQISTDGVCEAQKRWWWTENLVLWGPQKISAMMCYGHLTVCELQRHHSTTIGILRQTWNKMGHGSHCKLQKTNQMGMRMACGTHHWGLWKHKRGCDTQAEACKHGKRNPHTTPI